MSAFARSRRIATRALQPASRSVQANVAGRSAFLPRSRQASSQAASVADNNDAATRAAYGPALRTLRDPSMNISVGLHKTTVSLTAPALGLEEPFHVDHVWLRDICQEANSVEPASKQKLFHTSDIARDAADGLLQIKDVELVPSSGVQSELPTLKLVYAPQFAVSNAFSDTFSTSVPSSSAPHVSHVSLLRILQHASARRYARSHGDVGGTAQIWQSSEMSTFPASAKPPARSQDVVAGEALDTDGAFSRPARINWGALLTAPNEPATTFASPDVLSPQEIALAALVDGLLRDGIAFVTGVPTDRTGDSTLASDATSANLARLAEMLGEIRNTFYGSLWNVRSLGSASRNIAYTNVDLGFHMDLCYFQNPPRFQFLHMLRNRVAGGQSLFVDSFAVAQHMWEHDRAAWQTLSQTPVCFEYLNDGRHYRYTHPTFEVAPPSSGHAGAFQGKSQMPRLTAVNYSPPFQGALPVRWPAQDGVAVQASPEQRGDFYRALGVFADLTHDQRFRYERTLQEGECVVFDNRRVLHSRRGFEWDESESKAGAGQDDVKRWLKGCYVDGDAVWSTYRVLLAKARGGWL